MLPHASPSHAIPMRWSTTSVHSPRFAALAPAVLCSIVLIWICGPQPSEHWAAVRGTLMPTASAASATAYKPRPLGRPGPFAVYPRHAPPWALAASNANFAPPHAQATSAWGIRSARPSSVAASSTRSVLAMTAAFVASLGLVLATTRTLGKATRQGRSSSAGQWRHVMAMADANLPTSSSAMACDVVVHRGGSLGWGVPQTLRSVAGFRGQYGRLPPRGRLGVRMYATAGQLDPPALKAHLDALYVRYATPAFIPTDPIRVPHRYAHPCDQEIMGFLAALLAFGSRQDFLRKLDFLCDAIGALGDGSPRHFVAAYDKSQAAAMFAGFKYRFFTEANLHDYFAFLHAIRADAGGLRTLVFEGYARDQDVRGALVALRDAFLASNPQDPTSVRFIGNPKTSACKKMNMFLRWMVRSDAVDLGLWTAGLPPSALLLPLDVHAFRTARALGLTQRRSCSFAAVLEITERLRELDPSDPIRYDFALFGVGALE